MVGPLPMDAFAALKPGVATVTDVLEQARETSPQEARIVRDVLLEVMQGLKDVAAGAAPKTYTLETLDQGSRTLLAQVLGEGEVKAILKRPDGGEDRVQESVLPGLWRILENDVETLEVTDIPKIVRKTMRDQPLGLDVPSEYPEDAMNVGSVLLELDHATRGFEFDGTEREVNLTLLPMTPADMEILDRVIGVGAISIVSLGYGNCRIDACARRHLWTVRFYNTEDTQILNAVHAGDVPVAARATAEDMADSAERLESMTDRLFS